MSPLAAIGIALFGKILYPTREITMVPGAQMIRNPRRLGVGVWAFVAVSLGTLAWRGLMIPWDPGGAWFHFWCCGAAAIALAKLDSVPKRLRAFCVPIVWSIGLILPIGSMYFAPQPLFYFLFLGCILILLCWTWPKKISFQSVAWAVALFVLLVASAYGCVDGIEHMGRVLRLRSIGSKLDSVDSIEMRPLSVDSGTLGTAIRIADRNKTGEVLRALEDTYPYSPNHEGIHNPWEVTIRFHSGETLTFELGRGNREHPNAAWIKFDRGVYQNKRLYETLVVDHILPQWN